MAKARFSLLSLPIEILEIVASFSGSGILNLRWTCNELQAKTFRVFCFRYFESRQVWVDRLALDTLQAISEDERIGPTVHSIVFSMHNYHDLARNNNNEEEKIFQDRQEDQDFILRHGYTTHSLVCIMNNLVSLKTIEISQNGNWELARPDEPSHFAAVGHLSNSMVRSGPPYPSTEIEGSEMDDLPVDLWMVIITAISTSKRKLLSFKLSGPGFESLRAHCFHFTSKQLEPLADAFSSLNSLSLGLSICDAREGHVWNNKLPKFLRSCVHISQLSLYVYDPTYFSGYNDTPFLDILTELPFFPNLKDLTICNGMITSTSLYEFLIQYKEILKTISLQQICLIDGAWRSLVRTWAQALSLEKISIREVTHDRLAEDKTLRNLRYSIEATGPEIPDAEEILDEVSDNEEESVGEDETVLDESRSEGWGSSEHEHGDSD
jgi:hypothetical protein